VSVQLSSSLLVVAQEPLPRAPFGSAIHGQWQLLPRAPTQDALFYEFSLERHVPAKHLLRAIDRFVDLGGLRTHLAPFYSEIGRPSIDPELLIRMLIVGYCFGIRSERRLGEEVHLNLAYRWFCRLGLDGWVPEHSTFSKNRHGRFRESDLLRRLFETVLQRCIDEGLIGGEGFAIEASLIQADASDRNRVEGTAGLPATALVGRSRNISRLSMMQHLVRQARLRQSSSHLPIRRRGGLRRTMDRRSLPIRPTT
jgi:transposase